MGGRSTFWTVLITAAIAAVVMAVSPATAPAQIPAVAPAPAAPQRPTAARVAPAVQEQEISSIDAQRGAMDRFLDSHPEIASDVMEEPGRLTAPNFLHDHPALEAFLESHPLVKADPRAFISPREWRQPPMNNSGFNELLSDLAPVLALACFLVGTVWVIRTIMENRRWTRSVKMHEELHAKLLDKFTSGQDFNAYLQSEGGRRLLEWAPAPDSNTRTLPNAIGRILWSVQVGLVLLLMGIGLLLLRGHLTPSDEAPLVVSGTLGVTIGAGFILSAIASYALSKHLGLIGQPAQETEGR